MNVISINGKDYMLKFGFNAIIHYCDSKKLNVTEFWTRVTESRFQDIGMIRDMVYSSLLTGALVRGEQSPLADAMAVGEWFDEVGIDYVTQSVIPAIVASLTFDGKKKVNPAEQK